jgi:catechol 2,3-dioxygenase-like lactoylglutathione lyase family enzyme
VIEDGDTGFVWRPAMLKDLPLFPVLAASDIGRARRWYEEKLGLIPEIEEMGSAWYRTGDSWFLLYPTQAAGTAMNTVAHWTVPDLRGLMAELRGRGVVFEDYDLGEGMVTVDGVLEVGGRMAAWFKDSEGNTFELTQT